MQHSILPVQQVLTSINLGHLFIIIISSPPASQHHHHNQYSTHSIWSSSLSVCLLLLYFFFSAQTFFLLILSSDLFPICCYYYFVSSLVLFFSNQIINFNRQTFKSCVRKGCRWLVTAADFQVTVAAPFATWNSSGLDSFWVATPPWERGGLSGETIRGQWRDGCEQDRKKM